MDEGISWRDDALTTVAQDTLGTGHVARRMARLIEEAHSFDSSTVVGLAGPWGSGKSSVIAMCLEELRGRETGWAIGAFTPWATSDSAGMMADFYATLTTALPRRHTRKLRRGLGVLAQVGAPALKIIPYAGDVAAEAASQAADSLLRQPSWDKAFREVSKSLRELGTPVLIVVDDVDRLQHPELLNLLKVIRLLGRFPGVSYLLAYDEQTLFRNLAQAEVGTSTREGARLFMEKIVQYPITIPPMLESQVLERVDMGLRELLGSLNRPPIGEGSRLDGMDEVFTSQLRTPRAIHRYLAQVRLTMSMHDVDEINDVDVILLTLLRVQFPDLYDQLWRWRAQLTRSHSMRHYKQLADKEPYDFSPLLNLVPVGPQRDDAQELLGKLFPTTRGTPDDEHARRGISRHDYFDRYLIHTVPVGEPSDADLRAALKEAATVGAGVNRLRALLTTDTPSQTSVAARRLRNILEDGSVENLDLLSLFGALLEVSESVAEAPGPIVGARRLVISWAANLIDELPQETSAEDLLHAFERCHDPDTWLMTLGSVGRADHSIPAFREVAVRYAQTLVSRAVDHLKLGDDAPSFEPWGLWCQFINRFGTAVETARSQIEALISADEITVETLASRFVTVICPARGSKNGCYLDRFDQEMFDLLAPANAALYQAELEPGLFLNDLSWANRRAYTRGRAQPPARS